MEFRRVRFRSAVGATAGAVSIRRATAAATAAMVRGSSTVRLCSGWVAHCSYTAAAMASMSGSPSIQATVVAGVVSGIRCYFGGDAERAPAPGNGRGGRTAVSRGGVGGGQAGGDDHEARDVAGELDDGPVRAVQPAVLGIARSEEN